MLQWRIKLAGTGRVEPHFLSADDASMMLYETYAVYLAPHYPRSEEAMGGSEKSGSFKLSSLAPKWWLVFFYLKNVLIVTLQRLDHSLVQSPRLHTSTEDGR